MGGKKIGRPVLHTTNYSKNNPLHSMSTRGIEWGKNYILRLLRSRPTPVEALAIRENNKQGV